MKVRELCLILVFAVCCCLPFSQQISAAVSEGMMKATYNGYTVASASGVKSVRVTGERLAGDCSVASHVAEVSECCSPVSVSFKAPDCGGEPQGVRSEKGQTVVSYASGKSVKLIAKKGHIHIKYGRHGKSTATSSSPVVTPPDQIPLREPVPAPKDVPAPPLE